MMKSVITFFGLIILSFLLFQCQDNSNVTSSSRQAEESPQTHSFYKAGDLTQAQLYAELDSIARFLARNREAVAQDLPARVLDREGEEELSTLTVARSLPQSFQAYEGMKMMANYALAKRSPVEDIEGELRVAVDPDEFPIDEVGSFIAYYVDSEGVLLKEEIDVESYNDIAPFPLLLINVSPERPQRCPPYCGGGGGGTPPPQSSFISVTSVTLKDEQDGAGYEEFELYKRVPNSDAVERSTGMWFDGNQHRDAAFRYRDFPDINKDQTYVMTDPIALAVLSGSDLFGFHCIEDDYWPGWHWQVDTGIPGDYIAEWNCKVWREDLGYARLEVLEFAIYGTAPGSLRGNDDIYDEGGFYGFTEATYPNPQWRPNDDMDMQLLRE